MDEVVGAKNAMPKKLCQKEKPSGDVEKCY